MLKATERLHWLDPTKFDAMSRAGQAVMLVFAQERDLEELERAGSLAIGRLLTAPKETNRGGTNRNHRG